MKKKILSTMFALTLGLFIAAHAQAGTATTTLEVGATIGVECSVYAYAVDFGYTSVGGEGYGHIQVLCPNGTPYQIALDSGQNGDYYNRYISNGTDSLPYWIYNSWGEVWGDNDLTNYGSMENGYGYGYWQYHGVYAYLGDPGYTPSEGYYYDYVGVTVHY
jgi:spore coat protein U-like protein